MTKILCLLNLYLSMLQLCQHHIGHIGIVLLADWLTVNQKVCFELEGGQCGLVSIRIFFWLQKLILIDRTLTCE